MDVRICLIAGAALLIPFSAMAADSLTSLHPEEAYPDNAARMTSPGPYAGFIRQVQQRLHEQGFDAGPVNGDVGPKTQAALAQFQLSRTLPASGMMDDRTLAELGMAREEKQSGSGGTVEAGTKPSDDANRPSGGS